MARIILICNEYIGWKWLQEMMMLMSTNVQNELLDPLVLPTLPFTSHSTLIFCLYIPLAIGCCMQNSKSLELKISAAQARSQSNLSLFFFRVFSLLLVLADIIIVIVDLATEAQSEKVNKISEEFSRFNDFCYMELVIWPTRRNLFVVGFHSVDKNCLQKFHRRALMATSANKHCEFLVSQRSMPILTWCCTHLNISFSALFKPLFWSLYFFWSK